MADFALPATDLAIEKLSALSYLLRSIPPADSLTNEIDSTDQHQFEPYTRRYPQSSIAKVRLPPNHEARTEDVDIIKSSSTHKSPRDSAQTSKDHTASNSPLKLASIMSKTASTTPPQPTFKAKPLTAPASPQGIAISKRCKSVPRMDQMVSGKWFAIGQEPEMQAADRMEIRLVQEKLNSARRASATNGLASVVNPASNFARVSYGAGAAGAGSDERRGSDEFYECMLEEDEQPVLLTRWKSTGLQQTGSAKLRMPSGSLAKRRFAANVNRELERMGISTSFSSK